MAERHGKNGGLKIGTTRLEIIEWRGTHTVPACEKTNTESNGYQEISDTGGIESFNGSFTAFLKQGSPADVQPGAKYDALFYPGDSSADTAAYACQIYVPNIDLQNVVKSTDPLTYQGNFMSDGAITRPTT